MFKTLDICPSSIQGDPQVQAACASIDQQLQELYGEIPSICFWPNIDEQVPPLLDVLAWEMHVDVWQGWEGDLDNATKRQLINQSIDWHQHKGTKYAVEQMLQTVFKQGTVTEWYEYGGRPYFFRIITEDDIIDPAKLLTVINAVYAVKNERSWLDAFIRSRQQVQTLWVGMAVTQQITTKIKMAK
jgi:phage tail P2-like protein